jgi:hypothetical protein
MEAAAMTPQFREILEEQRWRLLNSFGWGPFHDGLVQQRIDAIDRRLNEASEAPMTACAITELVQFGLQRRQEAERGTWRSFDYIFVAEIYRGANRISSRIEEHPCVAKLLVDDARKSGRAYALLRKHELGWIVDDYGNTTGDRIDVNAWLARGRPRQ